MSDPAPVSAGRLEAFATAVLIQAGCPETHARETAACLVEANLEGIDTHGVARLGVYARRVASRAINPDPALALVAGRGGLAVLDGDNGLGPVVGRAAMRHAIALAQDFGIGWVLARNSNHFAHAGHYAALAAEAGMIGLCASSGEPVVAPWGGTRAFFTNHPLAIGAPNGANPVVVDLATSVVARGQILLAARTGRPIPEGWAMDADGVPTTDPKAALAGSVLPMAGAKGYALMVGLEILTGILAGSAFAPNVGSQHVGGAGAAGLGQVFAAIDPTAILGQDEFAARMEQMTDDLRQAPARAGATIRLPGDRRRSIAADRAETGIPLPLEIRAELDRLATDLDIPKGARLDG
ncbi:Ldh family oxidoreductase [Aquabacter spiritensis]|uniref:Malate dehydrogenase (NAD) n=1 Tax=Aquabacter spiritensis TaxID=933073 RepID=A0A4R3LP80_9HYPH|nr:Ldh family oxidoreductase [Aquabacter spiritensis]TCT01506.1 malate dehydrogenase (NAD) [Aquabacter spiritensis]